MSTGSAALSLVREKEFMVETKRRENPVIDLERLGRRLKSARTDHGYTNAQQVASRVQLRFGIPMAAVTLGRYERGETMIPLDLLLALSFVYEQPLAHFLEPALLGEAAKDYTRFNA